MCDLWRRFMNWRDSLVLGCAVAATVSRLCAADAPTKPLPSVETVLKGIVERAQADAGVEQEFEAHYSFIRNKMREEFNLKGKLKKRETENEVHDPSSPEPEAGASSAKEGKPTSASRSHVPSKAVSDDEPPDGAYERKDVQVTEELLRRFEFTMLGRELWKGLPLLKLDFRPAGGDPPAKGLLERSINRMAGTIWVDETDFTVTLASFYLTEKVNVGAGVLGSVSAFECWFERAKTDDGLWHTRRVDWRLECREFLVNKVIEQRETWDEVRKVKPP
jgi:hypothetical protein